MTSTHNAQDVAARFLSLMGPDATMTLGIALCDAAAEAIRCDEEAAYAERSTFYDETSEADHPFTVIAELVFDPATGAITRQPTAVTRKAFIRLNPAETHVQSILGWLKTVRAYLPENYTADLTIDGIEITGIDHHGWTLDGYVIPRLESGMIFAKETT